MLKRFYVGVILGYRLPLILILNACLTLAGYTLAACLRFDFDWSEVVPFLGFPVLFLLLYRASAYTYYELNQGYWRYSSTRDLVGIIKAHVASTTALAATIAILRPAVFPRSILFIEFVLSILLQGGARLLVRLLCERFISGIPRFANRARDVLILGAGDSGHLLVKNILQQRRLSYHPVAVLDDNDNLQGADVFGVRVVGRLADLRRILSSSPTVAAVILAIPSLARTRVSDMEAVCAEIHIPLKRLQSFEDIACVDVFDQKEPISVESILQRENHIEHEEAIRAALQGKRILITGAGGSIGSEIVRQVLHFQPSAVTLVDNSEYNLYRIERELKGHHSSPIRMRASLNSVADEKRMLRLLLDERPEIVFHAAAYKHVPLLEANAYHAFLNNVIGTRNLLKVAAQSGVRHVVMISTDKAVEPESIMGCTKRVAELLVQEYWRGAAREHSDSGFSTSIVRFGNVINSNGSVVPLFREQILSGGPITVTHPDMERYFMSIREAVRLVLMAGTLGQSGEIYLLDMGKPIKIAEVAKKMLALYGRRDIPIVYTGIRPGEKLTEQLSAYGEDKQQTPLRKIYRLKQKSTDCIDVRRWIVEVEERMANLSDEEIAHELRSFITASIASIPLAEPSDSAAARA